MKALRKPQEATEAEEQAALFLWANMQMRKYPELKWMHHIPNGGSRNTVEAARLKKQGVKAGVSDVFLPVARGKYHGLYIEMKRRKGGKVSAMQEEFIYDMREQGYAADVCHGWEEAAALITSYMEGHVWA